MRKYFQKSLLLFAFVFVIMETVNCQAKATTLAQGTYKTIFEMLRDVPGLEVKTSNDKSGGTVVVRGIGSLMNQKPPLFVVDGSVYNGDITNINPQDVDAISVLKDAASASVYGSQAAGGVIIITSKKGSKAVNNPSVSSHSESAYTYFIEHKTPLIVIGMDEQIIVKGTIQSQRETDLVFIVKKKELLVPIKNILRVEMVKE
jgi:TonB-dependent SusC/RagA subfamily outer membrane receptor